MLLAGVVGDHDRDRLVGLLDRHLAADLGDLGQALGLARLEQLDHARQAVRDVRAGDAAGVERPHGQLRARLADRLGRDDPHRVAQLGQLAARHRAAVAGLADAGRRLALEHRANRDRDHGALLGVVVRGLEQVGQLGAIDLLALLDDHPTALGRDVLRRDPSDQVVVGLTGRPQPAAVGTGLELGHRHLDVLLGAAVLLADDHVLGDVDQTPGQVARVGRAERRVGQALAGAVGRDEVLEHGQTLLEGGLDRTLDDLALRIGHQAAHAGQLPDLRERPAGSGVGHHVDRVELVQMVVQGLPHLVGGAVPQPGDELVALLLVDLAVLVLRLDRLELGLVPSQDLRLGRRRLHVVLGDRHTSLGGEVEADVLERVEHLRDGRRSVELDQVVDQPRRVLLLHRAVDELVRVHVEAVAERLDQRPLDPVVPQDPADRGQHVAALTPERPVLGQVVELDHACARRTTPPPGRCGTRAGRGSWPATVAAEPVLES